MRSAVRLAAPLLLLFTLAAFGSPSSRPGPAAPDPSLVHAPRAQEEATDDDSDEADDEEAEQNDEADDLSTADDPTADETGDLALSTADAGRHRARRGGCPSSMVRVQEFCIDRYEAPNRRGAKPLVMQSANDAVSWCAERRKRLCTEDEWIGACEGEEHSDYPYGAEHVDGRCNDDKPWRKVDEATLAKWPVAEAREHAKSLYQATPSGWKHKCASPAGARDMTGNVEEWVVRTREHDNDWPYLLVGCYWSGCYGGGKPTCHSTNDAHGPEFRFYETGFRCCRDVKSK